MNCKLPNKLVIIVGPFSLAGFPGRRLTFRPAFVSSSLGTDVSSCARTDRRLSSLRLTLLITPFVSHINLTCDTINYRTGLIPDIPILRTPVSGEADLLACAQKRIESRGSIQSSMHPPAGGRTRPLIALELFRYAMRRAVPVNLRAS